ncbi:MAG: right-handed parallel beta-helix repeat-containing protein [Bacteroidia bacterium]|nr:right-handed parallel beta-helix repeat-containing protein [Bacteroidia bacterium]
MKAQQINTFLKRIFLSGIVLFQSCGGGDKADAVLDKSVMEHYTNNLDTISLEISKKNLEALKENASVKVDLFFQNQKKKAKVSLLLNSNNTSYSVRMRGKTALPGLRKFTLVAAKNLQDQILDKIYYQLVGYCGLIQLKSEFIFLSINGMDPEIFLLKEDFDKCLIERNKFRESVIVEISRGKVVVFNEDAIESGSSIENDLKNARRLLEGFMKGELAPGLVFNLKALGKHFVFADLTGNYDQLLTENSRFYYNPITALLEPIPNEGNVFKEANIVSPSRESGSPDWLHLFLDDPEFTYEYNKALQKISQSKILSKIYELEKIIAGDVLLKDLLEANLQKITKVINTEGKEIDVQNISEVFSKFKSITLLEGVKVKGNMIGITQNLIISESYFVPANKTLVFNKGIEINLIENAVLISFSKVEINGSEEFPVKIISTDSTGRGFHVITDDSSVVNYLISDNLNAPESDSWAIPSCITFYNGFVKIENSKFLNNHCEDGLNIFRSAYSISDCHFEGLFSDAFDADFSNGTIENSTFKNIGNDAIDISGSLLTLNNITVEEAQDKALSAGENSKIVASKINISNSALAITSKDNSVIELKNSIINTVDVVYAIFQKKPEFGPARVSIKDVSIENCKVQNLIETNSYLITDGDTILGKDDKVKAKLYGEEYGKATVK